MYRTPSGAEAIEFDGTLQVTAQNLGFGSFSAVDRALRFPIQVALPNGLVQIHDPNGAVGTWSITRDEKTAWIVKEQGAPSIPDGAYVQLLRTFEGIVALKLPAQR